MPAKSSFLPSFGLMRSSENQLLGAILLLIIGFPFFDGSPNAREIQSVLYSLVYITGLLAVGGRRKILIRGLVLLLPALLARWANAIFPGLVPAAAVLLLAMLMLGYVIVNLFNFILRAPRVSSEVLCAAVSTYLLLGITWAFAYMLVSQGNPGAFSLPDGSSTSSLDFHSALYFSLVTLVTLGYGDIVPLSPGARTLALAEAVAGSFYMAILIARLVAQYSSEKRLVSPTED